MALMKTAHGPAEPGGGIASEGIRLYQRHDDDEGEQHLPELYEEDEKAGTDAGERMNQIQCRHGGEGEPQKEQPPAEMLQVGPELVED